MADLISLQRRLRPALAPLGWLYGLAGRARVSAYEKGAFARWSPPVPCVSVGNIGWGGSGKTPIVGWLADWATRQDLRPCILTRGYRAEPPELPFLVRPDSDPREAGDEPLLLARSHPGANVIVDPVRRRSGPYAVGCCSPRIFLLDDGFQHRAVRRDVDLVLMRPEDLDEEYDRVIPSGSWREDASALARATAFLIKVRPEARERLMELARTRLAHLHRPVFFFHLEATGLASAATGAPLGQDELKRPYALITGVGEPAQVEDTARALLGSPPVKHFAFADHHAFTVADWQSSVTAAERAGAMQLVCTPKDAVKLAPVADQRLAVFDLTVTFGPSLFTDKDGQGDTGDVDFPQWWENRWQTLLTKTTT